MPLAAATAYQSLVKYAHYDPTNRILITGGAGGMHLTNKCLKLRWGRVMDDGILEYTHITKNDPKQVIDVRFWHFLP